MQYREVLRENSAGSKKFGHRRVSLKSILEFRTGLLQWWREGRRAFPWRLRRATLYHQIVSEVLLQRTKAETVAAFWPIFINQFPDWAAIAQASVADIEKALQPIGLSKQRAPRLHALSKLMVEREGQFSTERADIENLPGVGQYIANAIFTFAHRKPEPLMDTNMARVLERFFGSRKLSDIRYDPFLQTLAREILRGSPGKDINWAILDLASTICKPRSPRCNDCLLQAECNFAIRAVSKKNPRNLKGSRRFT